MRFGHHSVIFRFLIVLVALGAVSSVFAAFTQKNDPFWALSDTEPTAPTEPLTVVLDAGHGGEDGGASSADGTLEKDLNLQIAEQLCDLLKRNGVNVVMTRTEDILLYDKTVDYKGRKKALDLAARKQIAEEAGNCIFVSIHMNAYPQSKYSGLQVWYSPNHPHSEALAESIRKTVSETLQKGNDRNVKRATSAIYLLHHLKMPAVLVECGFLSNPEEAALLANEDYQRTLARLLFLAIMEYQT